MTQRQALKGHQKSLPSYPFLSLFDRDKKKNGKNRYLLNRYLTPKEEVEEKLQSFLQQIENKFDEEYSLDLYRPKNKKTNKKDQQSEFPFISGKPAREPLPPEGILPSNKKGYGYDTLFSKKSLFGVGTKNSHSKPTFPSGKEKVEKTEKPLLLELLLEKEKIEKEKVEKGLEKRERETRFFDERYKSKVGKETFNKLLFTYNNQSKDLIETKKHIVKQGYVMVYPFFPLSNNNQKSEKDSVVSLLPAKKSLPSTFIPGKGFSPSVYKGTNAQTKRYKEDVSCKQGERDSKDAKDQQSNIKDIRKAHSYSFSRTIGKKEKVEKTQHEMAYKKPEIYLRLFPSNTNQFAQTIAYIYQQIGFIPYLSAELKNDKSYTLPDNFGVDSITGKVYIKNNEIYLKYLMAYFSETKSSVLKSVIIFCFIERYEKQVRNVSDSLFFYFWFYIIIRFIKVRLKRKLENPAITLYKYKKNEVRDELKSLVENYMNFLVFLTFK